MDMTGELLQCMGTEDSILVCGTNEEGKREVPAIEPMLEESKESYPQLFKSLMDGGLQGLCSSSQMPTKA